MTAKGDYSKTADASWISRSTSVESDASLPSPVLLPSYKFSFQPKQNIDEEKVKLESDLKIANGKCKELETDLQDKTKLISDLKHALSEANNKEERCDIKERLQNTEQEKNSLEKRLCKEREERAALKKECKTLKEKNKRLEEELAEEVKNTNLDEVDGYGNPKAFTVTLTDIPEQGYLLDLGLKGEFHTGLFNNTNP